MYKIYKILIILTLIVSPFSANSHVEHYNDLNRIEFDIYRNNKYIGKHIFSFSKTNEELAVQSEINFEIKKLGVVLYKYNVKGTEYFKEGKLIRILGKVGGAGAFLDDYALWAEGLIKLYESTFDPKYLKQANTLIEVINADFAADSSAMYYYYSKRGEQLIHRPKEITDNVIPSSNSILANVLHRLAIHLGNKSYQKKSKEMLREVYSSIENYGSGYSNWLKLANYIVYGTNEIVFTGPKALEYRDEFVRNYSSNILIAGAIKKSNLPLLENRISKETYIFVCSHGACKLPVNNVQSALEMIDSNIR